MMKGDPPLSKSQPSSSPGRVVRIHLACRAPLPIGSTLRVTGARLWDPTTDSSSPSDARRGSAIVGEHTARLKTNGFSGGNVIGMVTEDEDEAPGSPDDALPGEKDWSKGALMGIADSRSDWEAYSVEMVTCPDTYPIWRTRRPVVLVLTDPKNSNMSDDIDATDDDKPVSSSGVFHHHYRYLAVTPGAENEGVHGLDKFASDGDMGDIQKLLTETKISTGSLPGLGEATTNCTGPSFPVTVWENPFLSDKLGKLGENQTDNSREFSTNSIYSEGTSIRSFAGGIGGNKKSDFVLANLPYRTLDIDIAKASVAKYQGTDEDSLQYTEDGVLIDKWNGCEDVTYQPYCIREGMKAHYAEMMPMSLEGDAIMALKADKPRRRIFIVCYHLPVIVSKNPTSGEWEACWAESLLAKTEDGSFTSSFHAHWVGTVTTNSPVLDESDREALRSLLATMDCTVLFFDESVRDAHYKGFCKQVLWLAFHHVDLLDMRMRDPAFAMDLDATPTKRQATGTLFDLHASWDQNQVRQWWEAFKIVNQTFAVEVAKMVQPEDIVWVHDYHLSLLPRMLEDEEKKLTGSPSATAARLTKKIFFLHIPFPVSMIFKEMDWGATILDAILHADVVGFHSFEFARHFLSSSKRILGVSNDSMDGGLIEVKYGKRKVAVTMSSVSVEPHIVDAVMQFPATIDGENELRSKHAGRMIIAGLDVAQYLSGIGPKLRAFEQLLYDSPAWRDRVVLVQRCLIPGARQLDETRTIQEIRLMVKQIKSKYGDAVIDYEEHFGSTLPVDQRLALWKASDCLLNTEVRCGLNLWPLEYVFAQKKSTSPGIVIASEFSASQNILNGALKISPFDVKHAVSTIDTALTMSQGDRETRHLRDIGFVSSSSSDQWIQNVLMDLQDQSFGDNKKESEQNLVPEETQEVSEFLVSKSDEQFALLDPKSVISAYKSTSKRVIILDFNGTIVIKEAVDSFLKGDLMGSVGDAPPTAVCQSLEKLCADPKNTVFVVSGDNHQNLEKAVGSIPGLGLAASNGSCFSPPLRDGDSARTWLALDLGVDWDSVKKLAIPILSKFTARTNGSFIKFSHSSIGWSYYSCDPDLGSLQAKYLVVELERELGAFDVRCVNLKGIVEVIPGRLNKGIIVKKILRDIAARDAAGADFILCMGDDISDENMFTSVFSFVSEMDEDYPNVVPSPPVMQLSRGTVSTLQPFLVEAPSVRCSLAAPMFVFTVRVGKQLSNATQYVDGAEDVADLLVKLAAGSVDASFRREKEAERHLKKFSTQEEV